MRSLLLFVVLAAAAGAGAQPPEKRAPLPAAASQAVDQAVEKVQKARKQFADEAAAVRDKLVADLAVVHEAEAKKGNADGAAAVRAEIERLKKLNPVELAAAAPGGDLTRETKKAFAGTWEVRGIGGNLYRATWTVREDGTLSRVDPRGKAEGKWAVDEKAKALEVRWGEDAVDTLPLPLNPRRSAGRLSTKEPFEIIKLGQ